MSPGLGRHAALAAVVLAALGLAASGCGPRLTREQRIEALRSQYTVTLESLVVKQEPQVTKQEATSAGASSVSAPGAGDRPTLHVRNDAILDIRISTSAERYLPGLTLDVEHLDAEHHAKERTRIWVDTKAVTREKAARVTHVLENVSWGTGDRFAVEVRSPIATDERSGYREFDR